MTKLVEKYPARPSTELPMLFQRILQNTIRDYFRRRKVRAFWTTQISSLISDEDGENDPLETLGSDTETQTETNPYNSLQQSQTLEIIEQALQQLPLRQRQAFLLRYWEEMDVAETAAAMGCSEGSVKTHCSRATHALAAILKGKGVTL
jgi:RNA polymerase sigma-70 factor (ECF subfamily)